MIFADEGSLAALCEWAEGLTLRLFTNEVTPTRADKADRYVEAKEMGYKPVPLADRPRKPLVGAVEYAASFHFAGELVVYGYYLTRRDGKLAAAHRWTEAEGGAVATRNRLTMEVLLRLAWTARTKT